MYGHSLGLYQQPLDEQRRVLALRTTLGEPQELPGQQQRQHSSPGALRGMTGTPEALQRLAALGVL